MEQSAQTLISRTFKPLLQKKLEERILDLINPLSKGKIDKNILKFISIAEEYGFSDELFLLKEMVYEIGRMQIEESLEPKSPLTHKEFDLENFLSKENHLEQIESGLKYEDRQVDIESGILDILAKNSEGKSVIVELKMNDYQTEKVSTQLRKYINEKKERCIFVAPKIKADLFYALKDYYDQSMLSFSKVRKEGENYHFNQVDESNVDKTKKPKFANGRSKSKSDPNLIRVVKPRKGKEAKEKEETKVELKKREVKPENIVIEAKKQELIPEQLKSYPLYYQVLLLTRPDIKDKEKYLNPIWISKKQKKTLENLLNSQGLEQALLDFDEYEPFILTKGNKDLSKKILMSFYPKDQSLIKHGIKRWDRYITLFARLNYEINNIMIQPNKEFIRDLNAIKDIQKKMESILMVIKYKDNILKKYRTKLSKLSESNHFTSNEKNYIIGDKFSLLCVPQQILNEELKLRVKRAEELAKIDTGLAFLGLYFKTKNQFPSGKDYLKERNYLSIIHDIIKEENEIYESILSIFKVPEELKQQEIQTVIPEIKPTILQPIPEQAPKEKINYSKLIKALVFSNEKYEGLTEEMQKRIGRFIKEEVPALGLSNEQVHHLGKSFTKFNLRDKFIKEKEPHEIKVITFFDNVMYSYLRKNRIPKPKELEALYKK